MCAFLWLPSNPFISASDSRNLILHLHQHTLKRMFRFSRLSNMNFYKCMLNEKLDFEIVHRNFRVSNRGERERLVMRGTVLVFCLLWKF